MAKFDLQAAKNAAQNNLVAEPMAAGYHRAIITQVAEVGLQPGFNRDDEPKQSLGIVFEDAAGRSVCKVMPLVVSTFSNFGKVLGCLENDPDDLKDLLGQQLVLEIEPKGNYPKILGYYPLEDGLSDESEITIKPNLLFYSVEEPQPEVLKQLHPYLKQAIAGRVRHKEA